MHGIVRPDDIPESQRKTLLSERIGFVFRRYRAFMLIVILPTLILAIYYYGLASDQYESRADFLVRRSDSPIGGDGMGQLLGLSFGAKATAAEAYLVSDYLLSHDAVARLRKEDQLVEKFRSPGTDWISRLWFAEPTPEKLLSYYKGKVTIEENGETGISHLRVHAFTRQDAYDLSRKLLLLGEERINAINERTYSDRVGSSRKELAKANTQLMEAQTTLTDFRRTREDIDPEGSGKAQIGLVSELTAKLVEVRARLRSMDGIISPSSPQYRAAQGQVSAMEAQIAGQSNLIAGEGKTIASALGDYEGLVIRRENAARLYAAAASQYEQVKAEAARKQIYLVRVVEPNLPVKSLFPERGMIVLTAFLALSFAFGIGWMLLAGVREHNL